MLSEKNGCYFFRDGVLRYWLSYKELGIELDEFPKEKILGGLIKDLEEKYLKASTELGIAKESEIREKLGEIFGIKFKPYLKNDIEFDGVSIDDNYILEVKWKNKPSNHNDIENFLEKIKKSEFSDKEKRLLSLSKSGFTSPGLKSAKSNNIIALDRNLQETN